MRFKLAKDDLDDFPTVQFLEDLCDKWSKYKNHELEAQVQEFEGQDKAADKWLKFKATMMYQATPSYPPTIDRPVRVVVNCVSVFFFVMQLCD
jgi:hypothetical protein